MKLINVIDPIENDIDLVMICAAPQRALYGKRGFLSSSAERQQQNQEKQ